MTRLPALVLTASLAAPAAAGDLVLRWPVDCTLGESCHIQQYVDREPGSGAGDFMCNGLTYDGHKGTDIALPGLAAMQAGVQVRAAADGVVSGTRDEMPDRYATSENAAQIEDRECGNGVVLRHPGGWETQYCHMKLGSIRVEKGMKVTAGTVLGEVGLSGKTQFPHLHLSVRRGGEVVDPFAPQPGAACGGQEAPLWAQPVAYEPGGVIGAGFSAAIPGFDEIKAGRADAAPLPASAGALVFWAYAFGGRKADQIVITIDGPAGRLVEQAEPLEKAQAQFFRASGKRLRGAAWLPGAYTGTAVILRGGAEIGRIEQQMVID